MGNIEDGSFIAVERILQDFLGSDIQVVGRLIQDEEIGLRQHQFGKGNPTPFTAADIPYPFKDISPGKQESRQCIADFYKDGYPYKEYLDENFLLEKCASREMTVLCGLTDQGEIICTSAVRMDEEFKGSALLMLRVVKEAYRGMGIGKAQE